MRIHPSWLWHFALFTNYLWRVCWLCFQILLDFFPILQQDVNSLRQASERFLQSVAMCMTTPPTTTVTKNFRVLIYIIVGICRWNTSGWRPTGSVHHTVCNVMLLRHNVRAVCVDNMHVFHYHPQWYTMATFIQCRLLRLNLLYSTLCSKDCEH